MRSTEVGFLIATGAFLILFCLLGLFYYDYSTSLMRIPLLAAGVTLAVVIVHLAMMRWAAGSAAADAELDGKSILIAALASPRRRQAIARLFWIFSVVPLTILLGYPLGLAVYLLSVLKSFGESWVLSLAVAGVSLAFSFGLFVQVLRVPLPVVPPWWVAIAG